MRVRRLDDSGDWTFGQSRANYLSKGEAVLQNVVTRLKSFKYDWFLDYDAEIDWFGILSSRNNRKTIIKEVERVTLATAGVKTIEQLEVLPKEKRALEIRLKITTIYDDTFTETIGVNL